MINSRRSRIGLIALLALLAVTGVAVAGTVDTTNDATSSSTSDWSDGSTATEITNSSKNATHQVDMNNATAGDEDKFTLYLSNNATDRTFYSTEENWTAVNASEGQFNLTLEYATAFETLERDANDNVTTDVKVVFNESASDEETVSFQIYAENDETNAVIASTGENDSAEVEEVSSGPLSSLSFGVLGNDSTTVGAAQVSDDVGVNQTATESVLVVMDDPDLETAFSRVADKESGNLVLTSYVEVEGKTIPVFPQSADAGWLEESNDTYATVNSDGSQVELHNANSSLESSNVTVSVTGSEMIGSFKAWDMLRDYGASRTTAASISFQAIDLDGDPFDEETTAGLGLVTILLIGGPLYKRRRGA
jgi:hypothetical protein